MSAAAHPGAKRAAPPPSDSSNGRNHRLMADTRTARIWSGWITFAGILLAVLGALNILEGLVALLANQVAFIDGDSLVVVDLTGLGIVMVVFGALLALSGIGLLLRSQAARIAAIVIVALHAIAQIAWLGAYPLWSLLMIALSVTVIFALTVHWPPRPPVAEPPAPNGGAHRADRDQPTREAAFPMNQPRPTPTHVADDQPRPTPAAAPTSGPGSTPR
ncbi:hypothetical protein GCM10018962_02440 [Dactylosporangium matsuzakiense]|uniref:DUF7144 domain-containing protein n=2 Tax=Dactylosporangium matsuzakiense TaxID=53360 RepID=A0A9W6NPG0_9ACTN|nr:hypothetical protein GCM10017581_057940 [Dactylosporangium matsuzakiense]